MRFAGADPLVGFTWVNLPRALAPSPYSARPRKTTILGPRPTYSLLRLGFPTLFPVSTPRFLPRSGSGPNGSLRSAGPRPAPEVGGSVRSVCVCVCVCAVCCVCVLCVLCVQLLACPRACVSQPAEQRAPDSNRAAPLAICCASPALPAVDRLTGWGSFARWIVAVVSLPRRAGSPLRPGTRRVVGLLSVTFGRTEEHGGDGDGGGQRARRCVRVCVLPYHIFLPMSFHAFPVALWLVAVFVTQLVCLFVCPQHQAMPI